MSNDDSDISDIAGLIAVGVLVVVGVGIYQILKNIGSFEAGQEIGEDEAKTLAKHNEWLTEYQSRLRWEARMREEEALYADAYCEKCGRVTPRCRATDHDTGGSRCMECSGGVGDERARWCERCNTAWENFNY